MNEIPIDLDKHRGMAPRKATDIRRVIAEVEANATLLRERQSAVETELLSAPTASWPDAVAKARYVLNQYATSLAPADTHHRDLVASVLADLCRLCAESRTRRGSGAKNQNFNRRSTQTRAANRKHLMQILSPRHVKTEEALRLGVDSGWYSTKVSGTFVSGPHDTEADCLRTIAELVPRPAKKK